MSKSLGNSPDPLELIDKYGADGVRVGMLLCSPAGNDLLYDDSLPEQGRNFANKIWNAYRLIEGWECDDAIRQPESSKLAIEWMNNALDKAITEIDENFSRFRISDALMVTYKLFWDDFSAWYLEAVKPEYMQPIDRNTLNSTLSILDKLLKLLHPYMPFITEELWQSLAPRGEKESIMIEMMPLSAGFDRETAEEFDEAKEIISALRNIRKEKSIPMRDKAELIVINNKKLFNNRFVSVIVKLGNLSAITFADQKPTGAASFMVGIREFFVPVDENIDVEAEKERISKELSYYRGFLTAVNKKLSNEKFVAGAPPAVVETEQKKRSDAEAKITTLESQLAAISKR